MHVSPRNVDGCCKLECADEPHAPAPRAPAPHRAPAPDPLAAWQRMHDALAAPGSDADDSAGDAEEWPEPSYKQTGRHDAGRHDAGRHDAGRHDARSWTRTVRRRAAARARALRAARWEKSTR